MFANVLKHECQKAFKSPWFILAVCVAIALSLAAVFESYAFIEQQEGLMVRYGYQTGIHAHNYLGQTRESCFGNWIVVSANAPLSASLFFYALPLLAVLPFAWSYRSEAVSGYAAEVCTRAERKSYLRAKFAATFATGAAVAFVPLVVNFVASCCVFPVYLPMAEDAPYVGMFDFNLFSNLFFTSPFAYVAAYTLLDTLLMGAWAAAVLGLSIVVKDRVKLMVLPYLFLFAWHYANGWLFSVLGTAGFDCNLLSSLRSESTLCRPDMVATLAQLVVLAVFAVVAMRLLEREEMA